MKTQQGQTLIETLVAAFILVMGITAALTLATFSLGATTGIKNKAVAIGLAREGIEVVKNLRDTNWLRATLSQDCYDFYSGQLAAYCYKDWLNPQAFPGSDIAGSPEGRTFYLDYSLGADIPWRLVETSKAYGLNFSPDPNKYGVYYYTNGGISALEGDSGFARKVTITSDNFEPFNQENDLGPRLKVTVDVWWSDKECPMTQDLDNSSTCKVRLETYLTNWKNF